jgi:hypothetical protein
MHAPPAPRIRIAVVLACVAGCQPVEDLATGRTDRVDEPPFVVSYDKGADSPEVVLLGPVMVDEATRFEILDEARAAALEPLANAMTEHLQAMQCCRLLRHGPGEAGQPYVYVGSAEGETAPAQAEELRFEWDKYPPMVVHVEHAAAGWRNALAGYPASLIVRLAIVDYPKTDEGFFGKKAVLGPGHEVEIRFLSAEMTPVQVLQVTGILLGPDGRALAAGGEGIIALDSPFWVQMLEARKEIDPALIERVIRSERRDDLPGRPLKWEAALDSLVRDLLGLPR